jgi:flagellar protein FliS
MTWTANPFSSPRLAAQAYARVAVETGVASADPHRLVLMLFDGAMKSLSEARGHMQRREIPAKGAALSRAIQIIEEGLSASVNEADGGGLATQLKELYAYLNRRIVTANLKNDASILDEVIRLLGELREAWEAIRSKSSPAALQGE